MQRLIWRLFDWWVFQVVLLNLANTYQRMIEVLKDMINGMKKRIYLPKHQQVKRRWWQWGSGIRDKIFLLLTSWTNIFRFIHNLLSIRHFLLWNLILIFQLSPCNLIVKCMVLTLWSHIQIFKSTTFCCHLYFETAFDRLILAIEICRFWYMICVLHVLSELRITCEWTFTRWCIHLDIPIQKLGQTFFSCKLCLCFIGMAVQYWTSNGIELLILNDRSWLLLIIILLEYGIPRRWAMLICK